MRTTTTQQTAPHQLQPPPPIQVEAAMGANIGAMRLRRGMSVARLAQAANIAPALLHDYEAGTTRLPTGDLLTIVDVLDMKISEVFAN